MYLIRNKIEEAIKEANKSYKLKIDSGYIAAMVRMILTKLKDITLIELIEMIREELKIEEEDY